MPTQNLHKFLFNQVPVRGALIQLADPWREALQRRAAVGAFPSPVRSLLGEMVAATVLMQSSIKFDGTLIMQIHGDGPVKLAVAEATSGLAFRATAKVVEAFADDVTLAEMVNAHGQGRCAITLDPKIRTPGVPPYQGVVPLYGDQREPLNALSQVIEHYMLQSEQLDTRMVLAANDEVAAGLVVQRMPSQGFESQEDIPIGQHEDFNRIAHLAMSLTRGELLNLDADTLLRRLFWQENLLRFEARAASFECPCGRERVQSMLQGLGRVELDSIVAERGNVEVGCEFCGQQFHFDAVDVGRLFTAAANQPPSSSSLQ